MQKYSQITEWFFLQNYKPSKQHLTMFKNSHGYISYVVLLLSSQRFYSALISALLSGHVASVSYKYIMSITSVQNW